MNRNTQAISASAVLSEMFGQFFKYYGKLFKISLIMAVLGALLMSVHGLIEGLPTAPAASGITATHAALAFVIVAVASVLLSWSYGALMYTLHQAQQQAPCSLANSFRYSISRFWAVLFTTLIATVLLVVGYLLFVLPGIFIGVCTFTAITYAYLDKTNPLTSIASAFRNTWGNWWRALIVVVISQAIFGLLLIGGGFLMLSLLLWLHLPHLFAAMIQIAVTNLLIFPWLVTAKVTLWRHLKAAKSVSSI